MSDYRNQYNPYSIMALPAFWRGALAARDDDPLTSAHILVHRLLSMTERGENVFESEEFYQWIGSDVFMR